MLKTQKNTLIQLENAKKPVNFDNIWTWVLLRWIGYGLFGLALINIVGTLVPLRLMNSTWEFKTMGILVESVPVPLLALAMVFAGKETKRIRWENFILKFLSWLALLLGLFYLMMIPLGIFNTVRLEQQLREQITTQLDRQIDQIQEIQVMVNKAKTNAELEQLLKELGGNQLLNDASQLTQIKQRTSSVITQGTKRLEAQAKTVQTSQRLDLLKNSLKWNLGALIAGSLFIIIWQSTRSWT